MRTYTFQHCHSRQCIGLLTATYPNYAPLHGCINPSNSLHPIAHQKLVADAQYFFCGLYNRCIYFLSCVHIILFINNAKTCQFDVGTFSRKQAQFFVRRRLQIFTMRGTVVPRSFRPGAKDIKLFSALGLTKNYLKFDTFIATEKHDEASCASRRVRLVQRNNFNC